MDISLIIKACIVGSALLTGLASTFIFKLKNDNPVEQIAEEVIKDETGITIDLTPEEKEKNG